MLNPELIDPFAGGVTEVGMKEQVAPDGQFVTKSVTALLYPAVDVTVVVELAGLPCVIVTEDGLVEIKKFGAAVIVNETVVV
jgi:predicted ThiF/HesA family dinucleotide-utilizing enzyme